MVTIGVQQHCDGHSDIFGATRNQHVLPHCVNTCTNTFSGGNIFNKLCPIQSKFSHKKEF